MDRGTEQTIDYFKEKICRIAGPITSGGCQEYFGFKHLFSVVFPTTAGAKRIETMQKWTMEVLADLHAKPHLVELFLFAPFASVMSSQEVFFSPIWVTPRKEDTPILLLGE